MAQAQLWLPWTASALAQGGWAELASAEGTFEPRPEWLEGASGTKLPSGQRGAQAERQASTRALSAAGARKGQCGGAKGERGEGRRPDRERSRAVARSWSFIFTRPSGYCLEK